MANTKKQLNESLECQSINLNKNNASVSFMAAEDKNNLRLTLNFGEYAQQASGFTPGATYTVTVAQTSSS